MRHLGTGVVIVCAMLALPLGAVGQVVDIPMNAQINTGQTYNTQSPSGDAIYPAFNPTNTMTIYADGALEPEGFTRQKFAVASWFYQYIDLNLAGITTPGAGLNLSNICARVEFDVRYFQDENTNTNPYNDAPVFLRLYTYANDGNTYLGYRDYSIVYAVQAPLSNPPYPEWTHVVVYVNKPGTFTESGTFNVTNVSRLRWYGTDWAGGGDDFVDWKNFQIFTDVLPPDIDAIPDPDLVYPNVPYGRTLTAFSCDGTLSWSVVSGPAGLTIDPVTGVMSGWTPTTGQAGQEFPVTVQASNGGGSTQLTYNIRVKEPPVLDGSNVAPPWGTIHGTIGGPQSSNDPSMIMDRGWAVGAMVDWSLDLTALNLERAADRASITFDEEGNLYWKTTSGFLASVSPAGALRWIGNDGGTSIDLGGADSTTPIVGDGGPTGRVYAVSDTGLVAFRKSDGQKLWETALPDAYGVSGARITPVLYDGALYVIGAGTTTKAIVAVNAADGEVIFNTSIATTLPSSPPGQATLVPNALGEGLHGLYFNGANSSDAAVKEMYCVKIDLAAYTATLAWSDDGGAVARSHVIYIPSAGRVGTHCWNDRGATFYTWDLDGSKKATISGYAGGHGFSDFGALDFDGNDVIAGGFSGRIARYIDIASPAEAVEPTDVAYNASGFESFNLGDLTGQGGWDTYGAYGAVQVVDDPTGGGHGKVLKIDPPGTAGNVMGTDLVLNGLDKMIVLEWDQWRADTSDNFWVADSRAYDGWYGLGWDTTGQLSAQGFNNGATVIPGQWQHVKYVFNLSSGEITLTVDSETVTGATGDTVFNGIDFEIEPTEAGDPSEGGPMYIDNVVLKTGPAPEPPAFGGHGWYLTNADFLENRGTGGLYQNDVGASVYVASTSINVLPAKIIGYDVTNSTMMTDPPVEPIVGSTPLLFEYDTGEPNLVTGGPVLGPKVGEAKQHIYYFSGATQKLVALTHAPQIPADFDFDQDVDFDDLAMLTDCAAGPGIDVTDPGCADEDMDKDGDIDTDDFAGWQRCYSGQDVDGNPDCY